MNSLLNEILTKLDINIIEGISYEIQACLESQVEVKEYKFINDEPDKYNILIVVDRLEPNRVHDIFKRLFNFIEYRSIAVYERTIYDDGIEYIMVSSNDKVSGYCCRVTFSK